MEDLRENAVSLARVLLEQDDPVGGRRAYYYAGLLLEDFGEQPELALEAYDLARDTEYFHAHYRYYACRQTGVPLPLSVPSSLENALLLVSLAHQTIPNREDSNH